MLREAVRRPDGRVVAPYITAWSEEVEPPARVVSVAGCGIGYADESVFDRDGRGVLWYRTSFAPGRGRPEFGKVHPFRQRRAMRRLLCQVCAGPADRTEDGVLWLIRDFRGDWPGWPERTGIDEPPVCVPCVRLSMQVCPALRRGAVAFRARSFPVSGVRGALYSTGPTPRPVEDVVVAYEDPMSRWVRANYLLRYLRDCTLLDLDELVACRS